MTEKESRPLRQLSLSKKRRNLFSKWSYIMFNNRAPPPRNQPHTTTLLSTYCHIKRKELTFPCIHFMLLPVCLDPIQAWTWLRKNRHCVVMSLIFILLFPFPLCSHSLQPLPTAASSSLATAGAQQHHWSLYCLVTWPREFKPLGSPLGSRSNDS